MTVLTFKMSSDVRSVPNLVIIIIIIIIITINNDSSNGVVMCIKDDVENADANGLKRFPEIGSSHGIPSKRIRDILGTGTDSVSSKIQSIN